MACSKAAVSTTLLECPVCTELEGTPKCLPCGHTVCETCVDTLVTKGKIMANSEGTEWKYEIRCPQCRKDILVPGGQPENLPTNFSMKHSSEPKAVEDSRWASENLSSSSSARRSSGTRSTTSTTPSRATGWTVRPSSR